MTWWREAAVLWVVSSYAAGLYAEERGDRVPGLAARLLMLPLGPLAWPYIAWRYMDFGATIRRYHNAGHSWLASLRLWLRDYWRSKFNH